MLDPIELNRVRDHYFSLLRHCHKPLLLQTFITRWIDLLNMYSSKEHFVTFEPKVPLLKRLVPRPVAILVVPFENTHVPFGLRRVSIFPLYPFRIRTQYHTDCSRDGEEMLQLYLDMTGLTLVGFHKVSDHMSCVANLSRQPHLQVYTQSLFSSFRKKCQTQS